MPGGDRRRLHILVLTDRDWTHPESGVTGTSLYAQVARWIQAGHHVTLIGGSYEGAEALEHPSPNLELHHIGTRLTVVPRAAWAVRRAGVGRDADVVLEVIAGITFLTPLWLRKPRVALVHHGHRVPEPDTRGGIATALLESLPLRLLYPGTALITVWQAAAAELERLGIPGKDIQVVYDGVEATDFSPADRAMPPRLLYIGRLEQDQRIEHVLDVLEAVPGATLDIAGDGDHRPALEADIQRRGLSDRIRVLGFVDEGGRDDLYRRAWLKVTASPAEGWCTTVIEAAARGTPSAAVRGGAEAEAIRDGQTGILAEDVAALTGRVREAVEDPDLRRRLGQAAQRRAREFSWDRTAGQSLDVLRAAAEAGAEPVREMLRR
jgi:glycosyltransferase involved in cell wall biosynthesis